MNIPLKLIIPNRWQTRQGDPDPDYIKVLALDIADKGLLQIPIGRLLQDGHPFDYGPYGGPIKYDDEWASLLRDEPNVQVQLAFGHNRLAAYRWLRDVGPNSNIPGDWSAMPVELRQLSDEQMADDAWSENERRQNVDPISRALAIQKRIADFGWTQEQAAEHLGISRPAVANLLRLLDLPEEHQALVQAGQISPRAADALLQLQAVPGPLREHAEKHGWDQVKPSTIIEAAAKGASSDELRSSIGSMISQYSLELNAEKFPLDVEIPGEGVLSPKCDECPHRIKTNKAIRCPSQDCFNLKKSLWRTMRLEAASLASGIAVLPADIQEWNTHAFYNERAEAPQILEKRCQFLRLVFQGVVNAGYAHRSLVSLGFPDIAITCARKGKSCTCLKALQTGQDPDQFDPEAAAKAEAEEVKQHKANEQAVKALEKQAARIVAHGLADGHPGAWRKLLSNVVYSHSDKADAWDVDRIRMEIAARLAPSAAYSNQANPDGARADINKELAKLGLAEIESPAGPDDPADGILRRWARIYGWLEKLIDRAPSLEAVRGNLSNLEEISLDLDKLIQSGQVKVDDPRLEEILGDNGRSSWIGRLGGLVDVLRDESWSAEQFEHVSWLSLVPAGDVNFKSHLDAAPAPILDYVLAIARDGDGNRTRVNIIRSRLNALRRIP